MPLYYLYYHSCPLNHKSSQMSILHPWDRSTIVETTTVRLHACQNSRRLSITTIFDDEPLLERNAVDSKGSWTG